MPCVQKSTARISACRTARDRKQSRREKSKVNMVWKGYRSRLHKCNDFNAYGLFSRDNELLSQGKIFKNETTTSGNETSDGAGDGPLDLEHARDITCRRKEAIGRRFLKSKPIKVLTS